jgi:hypothetical protein
MNCPGCNSTTITLLDEIKTHHASYGGHTNLSKCLICGLYFVNPLPNEQQLAEIYAGSYHYPGTGLVDKIVDAWTTTELNSDAALISKYKQNGKILDIGAGRGDMLVKFNGESWERWAHDPFLSQGDIDSLKKKIGDHVNIKNTLAEYEENTFDVVILRNVIEHTAQFNELIKDINRILKKDGILFIRTPNIEAQDYKKFKTNWYVIWMPGHIVFFSGHALTNTLEKNNYSITYLKPTPYTAPASVLRSDTSQTPLLLKALKSVLFAVQPLFNGQGGDLRAIARKT